jgi:hypothetical protein
MHKRGTTGALTLVFVLITEAEVMRRPRAAAADPPGPVKP